MKNEEFYKKIQLPKKEQQGPVIFSFSWLFYLMGNLLVISMAPLLGKYNTRILSFHEYLRLWSISALIVLVLNIIFIWFIDVRPYLDRRKGFYWRGNFTVIGKESFWGATYLRLKPGNNHRIKVDRSFFSSVRESDRVLLERSYLGDVRKIKGVSCFVDRMKKKAVPQGAEDRAFYSN